MSSTDKTGGNSSGKYTVVARRYRPKTFSELVGQSTVAQALLNAIHTHRVGHAYLFTGARGVGKTSTARIFAKALNASGRDDGDFDPNSDIALAIDSGEDMDVIEIDGASNRGIDEIRQLRANAAVRPSRSPFKIYIIDEVHMLTMQAFNALLKTLEEPPGHVKFIFCTTDPEKIPITVLSRCQRFDFPPVQTDQILGRLKFICENEGIQADEAALHLIARRAAGSMRDSQSLLEQLMSFGGNHIRVEDVHAMLGTADESRLASFALRMIERDAAGALRELHTAVDEGADVGQLAEQLLGYLRDMMALSVGATPDLIRTANPNSIDDLKKWGTSWGTSSLLSALQILDEAIVKMRHSVQSRVLLEIALVQICQMQDLQALSDLIEAFATGQSAPPPRTVAAPDLPRADDSKKKDSGTALPRAGSVLELQNAPATQHTPVESSLPSIPVQPHSAPESDDSIDREPQKNASPSPTVPPLAPLSEPLVKDSNRGTDPIPKAASFARTLPPGQKSQEALEMLSSAIATATGLIVECVNMILRIEVVPSGRWKAFISKEGSFAFQYFQSGENVQRLATILHEHSGIKPQFEFVLTEEPLPADKNEPRAVSEPIPSVSTPQAQLIRGVMNHPLVKHFVDLFEGQVIRVDQAQSSTPTAHTLSPKDPSRLIPDVDDAQHDA